MRKAKTVLALVLTFLLTGIVQVGTAMASNDYFVELAAQCSAVNVQPGETVPFTIEIKGNGSGFSELDPNVNYTISIYTMYTVSSDGTSDSSNYENFIINSTKDKFSVKARAIVAAGTQPQNQNYKIPIIASIVNPEGVNTKIVNKTIDNVIVHVSDVNDDSTPPVVTATPDRDPNLNGWYNSEVTVSFSAYDAESGIASVDSPKTVFSEGANQKVTGSAIDKAGNEGSGSITVSIDKNAPQITINGVTDNSSLILNQNVPITWSATDELSGVDTATGTLPSGSALDVSSVGTKTFTVSATDKAGNKADKTVTYKVVYNYSGILQPLNADGSSISKLGSTIPVKFQLTDYNGKYVSTATATLTVSGLTGVVASGSSNTGNLFRYDCVANQYVFNLSTKTGFTTGKYQLNIKLDDNTVKTVVFSLK